MTYPNHPALGGMYPPGTPGPYPTSPMTAEQFAFVNSLSNHPPNTTLLFPQFAGKGLTPQGQVVALPAGVTNDRAMGALNEDGQVISWLMTGTPQVIADITKSQPEAGPVLTGSFPTFASLLLAPNTVVLGVGQSIAYRLIGVQANGARGDVDPSIGTQWHTTIPGAHINAGGQLDLTGAQPGVYPGGVSAQVGGAIARGDVTVRDVLTNPMAPPPNDPLTSAPPSGGGSPPPAGTLPAGPPSLSPSPVTPDQTPTGQTPFVPEGVIPSDGSGAAPPPAAASAFGLNPWLLGGGLLLGVLVLGRRRKQS